MIARRALAAALSLTLAVAVGGCGDEDNGDDTAVTTATTTAGEKNEGTPTALQSRLSGAEEVPGPGADPGVGSFTVNVSGTQGCYELNVTMGEQPTKAHIHQGAKGVAGPVALDLMPDFEPGESATTAERCLELSADLASKLLADPGAYYVNVHSTERPDGAIRGQLAKS
jgi:hypothetical protein